MPHPGIAQAGPNAKNRHIRLVGQPVTLSRTPSKNGGAAAGIRVLAEFGFAADEVGALRRDKVA